MNKDIFIRRLKECRKRKYKTQQDFADAYKAAYGTIRDSDRPASESGMFGTVQSWEQGKTTPTAEVLSNICALLDCDADYLLGRIDERNHTLTDMRAYHHGGGHGGAETVSADSDDILGDFGGDSFGEDVGKE